MQRNYKVVSTWNKRFTYKYRWRNKIVEKEDNINLAKNQIEAVKEAINNGVTIITGGPGTGKTTTINTIIKIFENNDQSSTLCSYR